jgi:IclR family pca regulon transcriptional regulator
MTRLRAADAEKRAESGHGSDFSEALARGLTIISAFRTAQGPMTLSDVARAVDLPKATARRALYTLERLGYVTLIDRMYRLAPKILELATAYLTSNSVAAIVQPACDRICAEVRQSCTVSVLDGSDAVMVARALPGHLPSIGYGVGLRLPAYCSALGRVLWAARSDEQLDTMLATADLQKVTPYTVVDRRKLRKCIVEARRSGYAYANQEAELGFHSIAVPVRRYDGTVVAAMNIGARIEAASEAQMREAFLALLLRTTGELKNVLI